VELNLHPENLLPHDLFQLYGIFFLVTGLRFFLHGWYL